MNKFMPREAGSASGGKNIDSINTNSSQKPPKIVVAPATSVSLLKLRKNPGKKSLLKKFLAGIGLIILIMGIFVVIRAANLTQKIFVGQKTTFLGKIINLIRGGGDNDRLIGEDLGQVNILLLGIGGEGHEGPYLTDTMILAQIRPDIGKVTLTSIPRDYWATLPSGSQDKINAAFTYGFLKNKDFDEGGRWARESVEKISGLKVPYFALVDFSGFEKAVDQVGGLDIHIDRTFTDSSYPNSTNGYLPPITFKEGNEHMSGERALQFARSRHGTNNEASDFARSQRQQKIIDAFKAKVFNLNLIKDARSLNQLISIFAEHFHTNISPNNLLRINNLLKDKDIKTMSLSLDPDTGLVCQQILASNGAYVILPCESEDDVKNYFKNSFAAAELKEEHAIVWLANSTGNSSIYKTAERKLTNAGVKVYELGYTKDNLPQTTVFQANQKTATAEFIANVLNGALVNLPPPGVKVDASKVDIVVVLGQSSPIEAPPTPYIRPPARIPTTTPETASSTPATTTPQNSTSTKATQK